MLETLVVVLIVAAAAWFAVAKYLPASLRKRLGLAAGKAGCGSGCDNCSSNSGGGNTGCSDTAAQSPPPSAHRVIRIHAAHG